MWLPESSLCSPPALGSASLPQPHLFPLKTAPQTESILCVNGVVGSMADKMYWAARCKNCSGMVGYRDVRYLPDALGAKIEEVLPEGTVERLCSHCGTVGVFDLRQFRPTPLQLVVLGPP